MRRWAECTVHTHPEAGEAVSAWLIELGAGGVVWGGPDGATLFIRAYFPADERLDARLEQLRLKLAALPGFGLQAGLGRVDVRWVEEEDWAHAWKAHFHPQPIGKRLFIQPSWEATGEWPERIPLVLDPGMAFGTGNHPTTRLCLELLENAVTNVRVCVDVGTGSGILAIAAAKLGVPRVLAIDIDSLAVEIAAENARANNVQTALRFAVGSTEQARTLLQKERWEGGDLVVANITAQVLQQLSADLAALLLPGGKLIVSGIVADRAPDVQTAFASEGLSLTLERREQDWVAQVWQRAEAES